MKDFIKQCVIGMFRRLGFEIVPSSRVMPRDLANHLRSLFAICGVTCVFDVGANTGQYRDFLRQQVRYDGLIVSFEPVSKTVKILQDKCSTDTRWLIYHCALGAEDSTRPINVMSSSELSSFLAADDSVTDLFARYNVVEQIEDVRIRTLDSVLQELQAHREIGPGLYLKMDTQGYDLEVIKGAKQCLSRISAVQTELSCQSIYKSMPGYLAVLEALDRIGYQLSGMFPVSQDTSLRIIEADCVMINGALVKSEAIRLMWTKDV